MINSYKIDVNSVDKEAKVVSANKIEIDGKTYSYELFENNNAHYSLRLNDKVYEVIKVSENKNKIVILLNGFYFFCNVETRLEKKASQIVSVSEKAKHRSEVHSPMPGMVLKIKKKPGDEVNHGESVLILEAMKMENDIKSPFSGFIKDIYVSEGNPVEKGAILFRIE
ncbi:MAG: biotin/lipoyl-containing protein [Ignavibacteriaceae bacterium]